MIKLMACLLLCFGIYSLSTQAFIGHLSVENEDIQLVKEIKKSEEQILASDLGKILAKTDNLEVKMAKISLR